MALYRNPREEAEMNEVEEMEQQDAIMAEEPVTVLDGQFKKRYGDLRRHMDQKEKEYKAELADMRARYEQLARGQVKLPKSEDEVSAWMKEYPEFAGILTTVVAKQVDEGTRESKRRLAELEQRDNELKVREALMELQKRHPDFDQLRNDQNFHDWLANQSARDKHAIYESLNVDDAAFVIDKYKSQNKSKKSKVDDTDYNREAAKVVRSSGGTHEISDDFGDYLFSESQIERESKKNPRWYDANEEAIDEALRKGKVLFDITGGAR